MLNLILGRSGCGKTYSIRNIIKNIIENKTDKVLLIVPEQNSFETERAMLKLLGTENMTKLETLSFTRLCDMAFRKYGGSSGKRLDDSGRNILISMALEQVKEQLTLYREQADNIEIIELMANAIKEFKMCAVSPDILFEKSVDTNNIRLRSKTREAAIVMQAYNALLSQTYLDPLDDLTRLEQTLINKDMFKDYIVIFDEFSGFTSQQFNIIEIILKQCKECYVALCTDSIDDSENQMGLFSPIKKTAAKLINLAKKNNIKVAKPYILRNQFRFKNLELKAVESEAFNTCINKSDCVCNNIVVYNATDMYDESNYIAVTIKRLVMEEGYRYRDFVVIARNSEQYCGIIDTIFEKYDIPYFMDRPQVIDSKPLMNLLLSAFDVVNGGYKSELIFRYLKTGLAGFSAEEISLIENYTLMWDITGKKWLNEFTANPDGFSDKVTEENILELEKINSIRNRVIQPLLKFSKTIQDATGAELARASYNLLVDIHADANLKDFINELTLDGQFALVEEQKRLWDLLMGILDQTALTLGDTKIEPIRFAQLLKLVINSSEMAFIPQGLDEVTIGSADRIRTSEPKVTFIIGATEGDFPRTPVSSGIFTDAERKNLISMGLPMYSSIIDLAIEERFIAYKALTSSSEKLYITWPCTGTKNENKTPSSIVRGIVKAFSNLNVIDDMSLTIPDKIWSLEPAFEICAKNWNCDSEVPATLKNYFNSNSDYKHKVDGLNLVSTARSAIFKDPQKARALFGENIKISASQVEQYYLCRFQYFCRYGLKAKQRKVATFDALEYGSVMHFILENILSEYSQEQLHSLSKHIIHDKIKDLLERYVQTKLGGWEDKTQRFRYLFYRLSSTAEALIIHIANEFSQSKFSPCDYELNISHGGDIEPLILKLPDGTTISVEGKVDRVDIMKKDGKSYVRIVDYKTGIKEFKLSDIIYGLNAQMLIYLASICQNGEKRYGNNIIPAGILYMPAKKPIINADKNTDDSKIEQLRNKALKMNGLILDSPEVITGMEADAKGIYIPAALNDSRKENSVVSLAQMGKIVKHIETLLISMAQTIKSGDISANPASGRYDACAWCPYSSVCGYERGKNDVNVEALSSKTVIEKICKEEN